MIWGTIAAAVAVAVLGIAASTRQGRVQIATVTATIAGWIMHTIVLVAPTVAVVFAEGLVKAFEENRDVWARVVAIFVRELTGQDIDAGAIAAVGTEGGLTGAAPAVAGPLVDAVNQAIAPTGELTPESGPVNMQRVLGLNLLLSLQGWWTEAVGDIVSLGRFGSAADLPDAMDRALGLNRIARLAWRAPVQKAIAEPLTELYNRRYTFKKYTLGEAGDAWHRGLIGDEDFLDAAAAAGYSHDRAAVLLSMRQAQLSVADILDMSHLMNLPDTAATYLLRRQGYSDTDAGFLLDLGRARSAQKILDEVAAIARNLYGNGKITAEQLRLYLQEAHYTSEEVDLVLAVEDLKRAGSKTLDTAQLLSSYREGIQDAGTVRDDLRRLGYVDTDIDVLLALQHRVPSVSQILQLTIRGELTVEEAQRRLEAEGYSAADAQLLLSLRTRRLSEGQVLDALRQGIINEQQATQELEQLGFDPDQVAILLAFTRKELGPGEVQAALLRGLITEADATQRLVSLGYSTTDAALILELARRLLTVGQVLDAYGDGFIGRADAMADLQDRGYLPQDAENLVRAFELKRAAAAARVPAARRAPPAAAAGP